MLNPIPYPEPGWCTGIRVSGAELAFLGYSASPRSSANTLSKPRVESTLLEARKPKPPDTQFQHPLPQSPPSVEPQATPFSELESLKTLNKPRPRPGPGPGLLKALSVKIRKRPKAPPSQRLRGLLSIFGRFRGPL